MRSCVTVRIDRVAMRELEGFVADFAAAGRLAPDDQSRTLIALEELLTNLLKYGLPDAPGVANVTLELDGDRLVIEFSDDGQAFDPFAGAPPDFDRSVDQKPVGGLGLHLVRRLMDETSYTRRDGRNFVRLSRRVVRL